MNINSKFKWKSGSYFSSWASDWLPRIEKCTFNLFIKRGKLNNSEQQCRKHSSYITDHPLKNSLCWQTTESSTSTEMSDVEDEDLLPELSTWHTGKRLNDHSQIPKAALSHCYITHTHAHIDAGLMWGRSHTAVVSTGQIRFNCPPNPHLHPPPWVSFMIHGNTLPLSVCVCVYSFILFHMCGPLRLVGLMSVRWCNQVCCTVMWPTRLHQNHFFMVVWSSDNRNKDFKIYESSVEQLVNQLTNQYSY